MLLLLHQELKEVKSGFMMANRVFMIVLIRFSLRGMCLQAGVDDHFIGSVETKHQVTR